MKGLEPLSTGLQDRRSVIQLSYIACSRSQSAEGSKESWEFQCLPEIDCLLLNAYCLLLTDWVGEDRVEMSPRAPKTRMLALHHTPCSVQSRKSNIHSRLW